MRKAKKLLSLLLALSIVVSMVCTSALAAEEEEPGSTESCEHVWGEWEETTPAACEEDGEETRTCTECGETETQAIPAIGHDWDEGVEQEDGVLYTCVNCGESHVLAYDDDSFGTDYADGEVDNDSKTEDSGADPQAGEPVAQIGETTYATLQAAIDAAQDDDIVTLLADVETEAMINATKSITIDGGTEKHSVIRTSSSGNVVFAINKSEGLKVTFKNMKINATTKERGINAYEAKNLDLTLDNVELSASHYALNIASLCDNAKVTVTDSNLTGWCALQTWSPNSEITVNTSTLTGINDKGYSSEGWNIFQTIVVNTDATNSKVTVKDSTIEAKIAGDGDHNEQMIASIRNASSSVELKNCKIAAEGTYKKTNSDETVELSTDNVRVGIDDGGKLIVDDKAYVGIPGSGISVPLSELKEAAVAEVNGVNYFTLQAAIDATESGTVTLLADTVENVTVAAGKEITLDLNGKTLDGGTVKAKAALTNMGTVTIKDSSGEYVDGNPKGTIKRGDANEQGGYYTVENMGKMTIESGYITNDSGDGATGSSLVINKNNSGGVYGGAEGVEMTITGGKLYQAKFVALKSDPNTKMTIKGGEIIGGSTNFYGDVTVEGGKVVFDTNVLVLSHKNTKENVNEFAGAFTIKGGDVTCNNIKVWNGWSGGQTSKAPALSIIGGDVTLTGGIYRQVKGSSGAEDVEENEGASAQISGGTFNQDVSKFAVEGSKAAQVQGEDGKWTIVPATGEGYVATVGSRSYTTLQEAIGAAKPGNTVTLLTDTAESVTIAQNQNITLDLNGKTLSGTMEKKNAHKDAQDNADYHAMQNVITNYGTLTIMDSTWKGVDANGNVIGEGPVGTIMGGTDDGTTKYVSWYKDEQPQYTYPGRSGIAIVNEENATCTIKSGLIKRGDDGTFGNYTVQNKGHMIVENGLITNNSNVSNLVINFTKKKNAENKDSYINGCKAVMDIKGGMLHQNNMSVLKNDPGGELNISGDAALVWRVANENNYATNFYGTVNMTGGTIRTNGVIPLFSWKEGETEFPAVFNISGNAHLECNALESNNGVMGGYNNAYVTQSTVPTINISGNPTITVNKLQTVCSIDNQMTTVANRTWATINVSGGTFSTPVDGQYCAAGFLPISNSNGTYGVSNASLVLTPSVTSMTGSGAVTLRTTFAGSAVNATVTGDNGVTVTGSNGTYTVSLPNTTATYTFTAAFSGKTATCTVTVTRYTSSGSGGSYRPSRPSGGGGNSGGGDVEIDDPNVPLAQLPLPFTDVKDDDWFREAVAYAYSNSLIVGITPVTFEPDTQCDRAMVATILHRIEKTPEITFAGAFADVAEGQWYSNGVEWCAGNSIVSGYGDSLFGPQDKVTREQLASMLYRYAQYKGYDVSAKGDLSRYPDCGVVSDWAEEALSWAVGNGIVSGSDGLLQPGNHATRAQFASILQRFDEKFSK